MTSLEFVTLRVKDAIVDNFRAAMASRPSVMNTKACRLRIHSSLTAYKATVYLDLAGGRCSTRLPARGLPGAAARSPRHAGMLALKGAGQGARCRCSTRYCVAAPSSPGRDDRAMHRRPAPNAPCLRSCVTTAKPRSNVRRAAARGVKPLSPPTCCSATIAARTPSPPRAATCRTSAAKPPRRCRHASPTTRWRRCQRRSIPSGGLLLHQPALRRAAEQLAELKAWYPAVGAWPRARWRAGAPASSPPTATCPAASASKRSKRARRYSTARCCRLLFEFGGLGAADGSGGLISHQSDCINWLHVARWAPAYLLLPAI